MLADAEPDVAAGPVLRAEVALALEVVLGRAEQVGRARDKLRHQFGHGLDHLAAGRAGGVGVALGERRDRIDDVAGHGTGQGIGQ